MGTQLVLSFAKRYFFNLSNALNSKHNSQTIRILSPYRNISLFSLVFILIMSFYISAFLQIYCHFLPPKRWRKNRAVTIFGVIRENFLKRMQSHFYFVKRSPFFNANFPVCPFPEKLPAAFDSHLRYDKKK